MLDSQRQIQKEIVAEETSGITEWLEYNFYQPGWFCSQDEFPVERQILGNTLE